MAQDFFTTTILLLSTTTTTFTSTWTTPTTIVSIIPATSSSSTYSSTSISSLLPLTSSTSTATTSSSSPRVVTVRTSATNNAKKIPTSLMTTISRSRSTRSEYESSTTKKRVPTTWGTWSSSTITSTKARPKVKTSTTTSSTTSVLTTSSTPSSSTTASTSSSGSTSGDATTTTTTKSAAPTCTQGQSQTSNTIVHDGGFEEGVSPWTAEDAGGTVTIINNDPGRQTYMGCGAILITPSANNHPYAVTISQTVISPGGPITVSVYQGVPSSVADNYLIYSRVAIRVSVIWSGVEYGPYAACTGPDCNFQGNNGARFQLISVQIPNDIAVGTRTPLQIVASAAGPGPEPALIIDEVDVVAEPVTTSTTTTSSSITTTPLLSSTTTVMTTSSSSTASTTSSSTTTTAPSGPTCIQGQGGPYGYVIDGGFENNQWNIVASGVSVSCSDPHIQTYQGCNTIYVQPLGSTSAGSGVQVYQNVVIPAGYVGIEFFQGVQSAALHDPHRYEASVVNLQVFVAGGLIQEFTACNGYDCPLAGQNGAYFNRYTAYFENTITTPQQLAISATYMAGTPFTFMLDEVRQVYPP